MTAPAETIIDLLRHGEVINKGRYCGSSDVSLTPLGREQMVQAMGTAPFWNVVISSPLIRCAEIAQNFSLQCDCPLEVDAALQEIHLGTWEGRSFSEVFEQEREQVEKFWRDPVNNTPPEGEPLHAFHDRVMVAFHHHIKRHTGQRVLMITHGGVIRLILGQVLNMPLEALLKLEVPYAALSRVRVCHEKDGSQSWSLVFHAGQL